MQTTPGPAGLAAQYQVRNAAAPGQVGLAAQLRPLGPAAPGQAGLAVQLASNVLLRVLDQAGRPVAGGLTLTLVSSAPGADPTTETLAYTAARPVRRTLPAGTTLAVAAAGVGFTPTQATYQVLATGPLVATLVVPRRAANRLLRRR